MIKKNNTLYKKNNINFNFTNIEKIKFISANILNLVWKYDSNTKVIKSYIINLKVDNFDINFYYTQNNIKIFNFSLLISYLYININNT